MDGCIRWILVKEFGLEMAAFRPGDRRCLLADEIAIACIVTKLPGMVTFDDQKLCFCPRLNGINCEVQRHSFYCASPINAHAHVLACASIAAPSHHPYPPL